MNNSLVTLQQKIADSSAVVGIYGLGYVGLPLALRFSEDGKAVKGSRILVLGLAYKKNIDDSRESPAVEIMELLQSKGALVDYSDPHIPSFPKKRDYYFDLQSIDLSAGNIGSYDCLVLTTDHDSFDYELLLSQARLIIDTRGRLPRQTNVVSA